MKQYSFFDDIPKVLTEGIVIKGPNNQKRGTVYAWGGEGNYPHCHFIHADIHDHEVCVCLSNSAYFIHGKHKGKFRNSKEKELFDSVMRQTVSKGVTIWKQLALTWNDTVKESPREETSTIDFKKVKQPNYLTISRTIQDIKS